jgi:hypothetical protein
MAEEFRDDGARTFSDEVTRTSRNLLIPPFDSFGGLTGTTFSEPIVMLDMTLERWRGTELFDLYPHKLWSALFSENL